MKCTNAGHKIFLTICNIGLLIIGLSLLILGVKMRNALEVLKLEIPVLMQTIKAVIAAGSVIGLTGSTGLAGVCCEILWIICVHLCGIAVIFTIEFGIGVTLMIVRNAVENIIARDDCTQICKFTLKYVVLDLAMPSAALMMTIILIQALMIYSGVKLFFYIREKPKDISVLASPTVVQDVQMQNVSGPSELLPTPSAPLPIQPAIFVPESSVHPQTHPRYLAPVISQHPNALTSQYAPPAYAEVGPWQSVGESNELPTMNVCATSTPTRTPKQ